MATCETWGGSVAVAYARQTGSNAAALRVEQMLLCAHSTSSSIICYGTCILQWTPSLRICHSVPSLVDSKPVQLQRARARVGRPASPVDTLLTSMPLHDMNRVPHAL